MATSTAKTVGLILLIIIIFLLFWRMTPFIFAPFGIFPGILHGIKLPDFSEICFGPRFFYKFSPYSFLSFVLFVLWIVVIVWVYRDAERRGMNGILWALLVFIGNLIGLLIYLIVRSDQLPARKIERSPPSSQTCPSCQKPVTSDFVFCPSCGEKLHAVCPGCDKPVESDWQVCPHCGKKLKK